MKRFFTKCMLMGLVPLTAYTYGQTIVSTTPENRKAILEEFTGIHCVYCPQGHAIAEQILNNNPGNAFAINIHQGGYATPGSGEPDFRTPFGNAIAGQTGLTGYPAGTVNRHNFPGFEMGSSGTTAMGRGEWMAAANQILNMPSYLNMAVEASIDLDSRQLTVHVENYYTGDSPQSTNFLNVALLQNNTAGPQTGGNAGNNYNHMRRLVHLVTGQWGEEINTTAAGSFVDRTYTYTIPEDYNGVPVILSDMELVAFMTETHQEIISGNGAFPSLIGLEYQNDVALNSIQEITKTCNNVIGPVVEIENNGENPITSATIEYSFNSGETHTYDWVGNLTSLHTATIQLPEVQFDLQDVNTLNVTVNAADQNSSNNSLSQEFVKAEESSSTNLVLELQTDNHGNQTRWTLKGSDGTTIASAYGYESNQDIEVNIELPGPDCYSFTLTDIGNNGGASIVLRDQAGNVLIESDGNYGSGFTEAFSYGILGISEQSFLSDVELYPNPSMGIVNIKTENGFESVQVYDTAGKLIKNFPGSNAGLTTLNLSTLSKGAYILRVKENKRVTTQKILIK